MTKIISWNVNGLRACMNKGFMDFLNKEDPDIICLQETKVNDGFSILLPGYQQYYNFAGKKGYSGTAIFSKEKPIKILNDMGIDEHDQEGRIIAAEYDKFILVTVYTPNSKRGLLRLPYRKEWDEAFLKYVKNLEKDKPVIVCGDLNVAHTAMDIKNDKSNYNKSAGYTQTEIDGLNNILDSGFVDTFRALYPEEIKYSWWSYMFNARANNTGWRIDYFLTSKDFFEHVKDAFILTDVMGSDHCPIGIELEF
ncbi:exodeoxyribonuclease III [Candidatus Woesearchaeota archaeon]|nr:exodeoxyribonuclease III [Candidatus Woesearchaeota archaeon]